MMAAQLVTVIIPAYNAENYVGDAIRSVLAQTWKEVEIIVVDDGSSDGTSLEAQAFGPPVRCVVKANGGVASARNRGIWEARGEYVAMLDADDAWLPDKLERQLQVFAADREVIAVGCGALVTDANLDVTDRLVPIAASYEEMLLLRGNGGVNGSALVVRTDVVRRLAGYDTCLSTAADLDLALRLQERGKVATVSAPLFLYRQHGANMHSVVRVMERDMLRIIEKARAVNPSRGGVLYTRALGRLYTVLSGAYWRAGDPIGAFRCALTAVRCDRQTASELLRKARGIVVRGIRRRPHDR